MDRTFASLFFLFFFYQAIIASIDRIFFSGRGVLLFATGSNFVEDDGPRLFFGGGREGWRMSPRDRGCFFSRFVCLIEPRRVESNLERKRWREDWTENDTVKRMMVNPWWIIWENVAFVLIIFPSFFPPPFKSSVGFLLSIHTWMFIKNIRVNFGKLF